MTDCYSGKLLTIERGGASVIQIDLTNYNWKYLVYVRKEVAKFLYKGMRQINFKYRVSQKKGGLAFKCS